jgi:flavin-binding protein dodecin
MGAMPACFGPAGQRASALPLHVPTAPGGAAEETAMPEHVYKLVELVGSSSTSTDDAIRNAITTAASSLRHVDWFEVVETRGHVANGKVAHFQVTLKVGFRLEA